MFNQPSPSETEVTPMNSDVATQGSDAVEMNDGADTPDNVSSLKFAQNSESENWAAKYQLLQDQFTRLAADFDNFRKRAREEQESMVKYGAQKSAMELLPVLDNLDRASASLTENSDAQVLYKSFGLVNKQLLDGLDRLGIRKIDTVGKPFDPNFHEAVNQMPSEHPEHHVAIEAQSGYMLHDKVIRPAMVVVSTGPVAESEVKANPFTA